MHDPIDDRKAAILRAVIEHYIETDQPVGSSLIARRDDIAVSPATIRNEMAALEADGFLQQPHTSAGRVPTQKGYRFFVDQLEPGRLDAAQAHQVRAFFDHAHGELEKMLRETSALLSDLTDLAAVVVAPGVEVARLVSVQLVRLTPSLALVVAVHSTGAVEKASVELDDGIDDELLERARDEVARRLVGRQINDPLPPVAVGDQAVDALVEAAVGGGGGAPPPPSTAGLYVGGTAQMVSHFDAIETVGSVLRILEEQIVVVSLLRDVIDRGLSVAIGSETGVLPLSECSVVVAPYEVEGERLGSIGLLGPTRMNYPQALSAVAVVSRRLGRSIAEQG